MSKATDKKKTTTIQQRRRSGGWRMGDGDEGEGKEPNGCVVKVGNY